MAHAGNRKFGAAQGARFSDKDAQRYGRFLDANGMLDGPVDAERVIRLARPTLSPLHEYIFDVNDADAAHEYRLTKARELVRHIVVYKEIDGDEVETRAYHHVTVKTKQGEKSGYAAETVVWRRPELAEQVIEKALRELVSWRRRYAQYNELSSLFKRIDEYLDDDDRDAA